MIVEAFLSVIKFIVNGLIGMLPTIPKVDISYLDGVFMVLSMTDLIINIRVLASCIGVLFLFMNARFIWSVIMWVVRKIPSIK